MAKRRIHRRSKGSPRLWFFIIAIVALVGAALVSLKMRIPLLPTPLSETRLAADTTLSFLPDTLAGRVSETKTFTIAISSGKNTVTGVEFQLSTDSSLVRIQKTSAGTFFEKPTVLANELSTSGESLHFAIGSLTPKQGNGTLATVTLRLVKPGVAKLSFSDVKVAAVESGSTNVSRAATGATVSVTKP